MPSHTIAYHSIQYHHIPYHTIQYHTIPYHTIPFHTIHIIHTDTYSTYHTYIACIPYDIHYTHDMVYIYDIWYMIYDIWYMIWYMIYDIWYMIYDIWYMIYDIWYMIYDIWYMIYLSIYLSIYVCMYVRTYVRTYVRMYVCMYHIGNMRNILTRSFSTIILSAPLNVLASLITCVRIDLKCHLARFSEPHCTVALARSSTLHPVPKTSAADSSCVMSVEDAEAIIIK